MILNLFCLVIYYYFLVNFIISIIPSLIPCIDDNYNLKDNSFDDDFYKTICQIKENNSTILYYESYSIYFKVLFKNNILLLILYFLKLVLNFLNKLFYLYIIKDLAAEYIICANSIYYIIAEIFDSCYFLFNKSDFKFYKFYGLIAQIFSFLGTLVYLELIELHFCEIDFNLKKNIKKRAIEDEDENKDEIKDENKDEDVYEDLWNDQKQKL